MQLLVEACSSLYLCNLDQLIIIIMPIKEWLLAEYLHSTQALDMSINMEVELGITFGGGLESGSGWGLARIYKYKFLNSPHHLSPTDLRKNSRILSSNRVTVDSSFTREDHHQMICPGSFVIHTKQIWKSSHVQQNIILREGVEGNAYHSSKHTAQTPQVQGVIIVLQINKKFRALKVSAEGMYEN